MTTLKDAVSVWKVVDGSTGVTCEDIAGGQNVEFQKGDTGVGDVMVNQEVGAAILSDSV